MQPLTWIFVQLVFLFIPVHISAGEVTLNMSIDDEDPTTSDGEFGINSAVNISCVYNGTVGEFNFAADLEIYHTDQSGTSRIAVDGGSLRGKWDDNEYYSASIYIPINSNTPPPFYTSLTILSTRANDNGTYQCLRKNNAGVIFLNGSMLMNVYAPIERLEIEGASNENLTRKHLQMKSIKCKAIGGNQLPTMRLTITGLSDNQTWTQPVETTVQNDNMTYSLSTPRNDIIFYWNMENITVNCSCSVPKLYADINKELSLVVTSSPEIRCREPEGSSVLKKRRVACEIGGNPLAGIQNITVGIGGSDYHFSNDTLNQANVTAAIGTRMDGLAMVVDITALNDTTVTLTADNGQGTASRAALRP